MKKLTPNQKLTQRIKLLETELESLKRENGKLSDILAKKRVNETLSDKNEVARWFRDITFNGDYKREELIRSVLGMVERGLRGARATNICQTSLNARLFNLNA